MGIDVIVFLSLVLIVAGRVTARSPRKRMA
jgi:hypothetical protein